MRYLGLQTAKTGLKSMTCGPHGVDASIFLSCSRSSSRVSPNNQNTSSSPLQKSLFRRRTTEKECETATFSCPWTSLPSRTTPSMPMPASVFFLIRKICAAAANSIADPPSTRVGVVMEQIVGAPVSLQLNEEIALIRRVYEDRNLDECADVPALLMRCAGPERLTYVWVLGSIKSRLMFLWRASSFAPQNK